ncbi:hypothetical protein EIP86_002459 [Pleurotus ostreatoroseus]|nr:hypothetical protein EIP86_002459 [Pleurotus ostreatoroseus]
MLSALTTGARSMDQDKVFTPTLDYIGDSALEKNERERKGTQRLAAQDQPRPVGHHLLDREPRRRIAPVSVSARVPLSVQREFMDGQHSNTIDDVCHYSNCDCFENIAIGRRKGPLGNKSCPVQYNADLEYQLNLRREEEQAKATVSRKRPHHGAPSSVV